MNPYEAPATEPTTPPAEPSNSEPGCVAQTGCFFLGCAFESFLLAGIAVVYIWGGELAAYAIFIGVPVGVAILFAMMMAWAWYREPVWKRQRHDYLREKRRKLKEQRTQSRRDDEPDEPS